MFPFLFPLTKPISWRLRLVAVIAALCLALGSRTGHAGEPSPQFSYVYAPILGTGFYKAGDANIVVLRLPLSYDLTDDPKARIDQRLLLTASAGFSSVSLNSFTGGKVQQNLQTYSLMPGVGWNFRIQPRWRVKTYVQLGLAHDMASDATAYLGAAGVRSSRLWPWKGGWVTLGNGVLLAGQRVDGSQGSQGFLLYENGVDYTHSIGLTALGKPLSLGTFVLWRHFGNHLKFAGIAGEQIELKDLYSVGLTLGFNGSVDWHHIPLHRIGLSLVRGDNLKAVSLNLGFPF